METKAFKASCILVFIGIALLLANFVRSQWSLIVIRDMRSRYTDQNQLAMQLDQKTRWQLPIAAKQTGAIAFGAKSVEIVDSATGSILRRCGIDKRVTSVIVAAEMAPADPCSQAD